MQDVHALVIGGGAVGLACAAAIARGGRSVMIVERHRGIGGETSSRNSGVIHAGLYYPTGSAKARLCVAGRELLYARCAREALPHRNCGKLVVATEQAELAALEAIFVQAQGNGAGAVRIIDRAELSRLEPNVHAIAALVSPATGIVDAHALIDSYRREAESHDAMLALNHTVTALERRADWQVRVRSGAGEETEVHAAWLVNAAGLGAPRIAELAGLDIDALGYRQHPCKGDYFRVAARHRGLASHLVYPVPAEAGLGIHLTFDLDGNLTAGPDTEYVSELRYDIDAAKASGFGVALRRYLPQIADDDLTPDYAGIRPKLSGPSQGFRDFVIEEASTHGAPQLVNLLGIESPGLTAGEAIANHVASIIAT